MSTDCTISPADVSAFSRSLGSWQLTLCRLTVGGFGFVRGHAGPRLGLHVNAVHILENTGKKQKGVFNLNDSNFTILLYIIEYSHGWESNPNI